MLDKKNSNDDVPTPTESGNSGNKISSAKKDLANILKSSGKKKIASKRKKSTNRSISF